MNAISSASRARFDTPSFGTESWARIGPVGEGSPCRRARSTGQEAGNARARRPDHEGPGQAEQLDEHEAGGQRPKDRADRIRGVEPPEGEAEVRVTGQVPCEDRQSGTHQHRGRRQGQERQPEPHQSECLRAGLEGRVDPAVELADQPERQRRGKDDHHEHELDEAIEPQRGPDTVADPAADDGADRHAAEEPGQDRRDGLGRIAEDQHELARPDDLVDETGRPGQDEDPEDSPASSHPTKGRTSRRSAP